jgi:hypothetical protein
MARRPTASRGSALVAAYRDEEACPTATKDVHVNLKNRNHAIEDYGYGPMNPELPNNKFWKALADLWDVTPAEAKASRCGNCAAFIQTPKMLECISAGMAGDEEFEMADATSVAEASNLGYCQLFHFKCAGSRTCDAWLVGGPITKEGRG